MLSRSAITGRSSPRDKHIESITALQKDTAPEVISLRDTRRQAALNVALLSEIGCHVHLQPYADFNGYTVTNVKLGNEVIFSVQDVKQASYEGRVSKSVMKGFHDMLFNGSSSYLLIRKGYTIVDSFCETEIYPFYRMTDSVLCPDGKRVVPNDRRLDAAAIYLDCTPNIQPFDKVLMKLIYEMSCYFLSLLLSHVNSV